MVADRDRNGGTITVLNSDAFIWVTMSDVRLAIIFQNFLVRYTKNNLKAIIM